MMIQKRVCESYALVRSGIIFFAAIAFPAMARGQVAAPVSPAPSTQSVRATSGNPPTILKEFPTEITVGELRLYDFTFEPASGSLLTSGTRVAMRFKYENAPSKKTIVGAMPMAKDQYAGGHQPIALQEGSGTAEVGVLYGNMVCGPIQGGGAAPPITTKEQLEASYLRVDFLEISVFGDVPQTAFRVPLEYRIVPPANFTVQEKYYIDRLIQELTALRRRVEELERTVEADRVTKPPKSTGDVELKPSKFIVTLPAEADLEIAGSKMPGMGTTRRFDTPPLETGKELIYGFKATWIENGASRWAERRMKVRGGQVIEIDLTTADDMTVDERAVLDLINQERAKTGAMPLKGDNRLCLAARQHSENMATKHSLSHTLDGKRFFERIDATGYRHLEAGENIAQGATTPAEAVQMWMHSSGHRANLLNPRYTETGIGVAYTKNGESYWTQVFAVPAQE